MPTSTLSLLLTLPLAASPLVYLFGRLAVLNRTLRGTARWLALLVVLAVAYPLGLTAQAYLTSGQPQTITIGLVPLRFDGISLILAATVWLATTLVVLFSHRYMAGEAGEEKFYSMLLAMSGTIIGLGCAQDLFNLWVWFEAMAITSYLLVAFYRQQPASLEAGVKYLVQSAAGSVLVLLGITLIFAQTASLDFDGIGLYIKAGDGRLIAAGALIMIGFGVKAALVPLHTWLPDAHSQAPSGISAMLSGVVIEAGLIAMLRTLGSIHAASLGWGPLLLGFGALNILVGNLMALRQEQVKRLLAYSSLSHVGYMLLGFGAAITFGQAASAAGASFHFVTHALMKSLAFLSAGVLLYGLHLSRGDHRPLLVSDLNGAAQRYPLAALTLSIAVLGLGGLPPLAGFMSKWQIFVGGFQTHNGWVIALVVFAALNSVLSLGYYAPLVNRMYRQKPSSLVTDGSRAGWQMHIPLLILAAATVLLGFAPQLANWIVQPAAADLLSMFGW